MNYFLTRSIFTRLLMAKEWAMFSTGYRPLRVSDPRGDQVSRHFLQISWRYGIPLTVVSGFLHWLLSCSIYVLVAEGGEPPPSIRVSDAEHGRRKCQIICSW